MTPNDEPKPMPDDPELTERCRRIAEEAFPCEKNCATFHSNTWRDRHFSDCPAKYQTVVAAVLTRELRAERVKVRRETLKEKPFAYAIETSKGDWVDGDDCIFDDLNSAQDRVDGMNEELDKEDWYRLVPLYRLGRETGERDGCGEEPKR